MKKCVFLLGWVVCLTTGFGFDLARDGAPQAVIWLREGANPAEERAAAELAKYVKQMSGADLAVNRGATVAAGQNAIVIGLQEKHPEIRRLLDAGGISGGAFKEADGDAFLVKTSRDGKRLVLSSRMDRGVLYAVYHLLEKHFGVGFFWEGDRAPARKSLALGRVDEREVSRFRIRQYPQECTYAYTCRLWTLPDWEKEIDWMLKRKLNTLLISADLGQNCDCLLAHPRDIAQKARNLGLEVCLFVPPWDYLAESEKTVGGRELRTVPAQQGGDPVVRLLHPDDPLFKERLSNVIRSYVQACGTGLVYKLHPYGELMIRLPEQEERDIWTAYARVVTECVRQTDPTGRIYIYGWSFMFFNCKWRKTDAHAFLDGFSSSSVTVGDAWAEKYPLFNTLDWFWSKEWLYGVIYLFGGDDSMRGDLRNLARQMTETAGDARAAHCVGVDLNPEITHYNPVGFHLLTSLAWNPKDVAFDQWLADYVKHRYGEASFARASEAMRLVADAVYSGIDGSEAFYQHRPMPVPEGVYLTPIAKSCWMSGGLLELRKALEILLSMQAEQKDNPCYERDVVDVTRQYLTELYNRYFMQAQTSIWRKDPAALQTARARMDRILDQVLDLLKAYPPYQVRTLLAGVGDGKRKHPYAYYEKMAKDSMLTYASKEWLLDYASKDMYELVRDYYRPRMDVYWNAAGKVVQTKAKFKEDAFLADFRKVEKDWLDKPLAPVPPAEGKMVMSVASGILRNLKQERLDDWVDSLTRTPLKDVVNVGEDTDMAGVVWSEEFDDVQRWKRTFYEGGSLTASQGVASIAPAEKTGVCFFATVGLPIEKTPALAFRSRRKPAADPGHERTAVTEPFVLWVAWEDQNGKAWRSRLWSESCNGEWKTVTLDLRRILSVLSPPKTVKEVWIENMANAQTEWDWIRLGTRKSNNPQK